MLNRPMIRIGEGPTVIVGADMVFLTASVYLLHEGSTRETQVPVFAAEISVHLTRT